MKSKNKYKPPIIILVIIAVIGAILIWGQVAARKEASRPKMILFYGDTCPHCKNVEEYINANNVKAKLSFQELEVYNNKVNAKLLGDKAKQCGLDTSQGVGVPFFFDGQNCISGDQDIINFFQK
jgi:glutaredoxin